MKISLNWIKEFTDLKLSVDRLVEKIGAQLGAVEEVIDLGKKYEGILVAKIMSCVAHPNADKLSLCTIDDGGKAKHVKRDKHGHVQVVCGAPNVRRDMLVAWIPPGVTVPSTYDKDPFVLEARQIRGQMSNGMLASASELAISEDHTGILEIREKAKPGDSFAKAFGLDDYIIDIENKMFTHRPDCFGILGVAREIAGVLGQKFESPKWYQKAPKLEEHKSDSNLLSIKNEIPKLVPRFTVKVISGVNIGPSPMWIQSYLSRVGIKPINNIVDITNYYMYLTGQPLHAYDYDKVGKHMVIRHPKKGEKITLLGGKEVEPHPQAIMIASRDKLIGIGGVMGGADTEVSEGTSNIILECASFDKYSIHRTAMKHGLFTDAVTRFSKGPSPRQIDRVLIKAAEEIASLAGGKPAESTHDVKASLPKMPLVSVSPNFISERLGNQLGANEINKLLKNVEFDTSGDRELYITPPFWRTDIHIPEDIVEEVGRLHGYDKLPLNLPKRDLAPAAPDQLLNLKYELRQTLSKIGANEVLSYSFVHGKLLEKAGQNKDHAFQIANALSPDLQYYRISLVPSLLDKIHSNIKAGFDSFAVFEVNKVHDKSHVDEQGLPVEEERMALVFAADDKYAAKNLSGSSYYQAANYLVELLSHFGIRPSFVPVTEKAYKSVTLNQCLEPFEPERTAYVMSANELIGVIGEFKANVRKNFKLPNYVAGVELNIEQILKAQSQESPYVVLPRFPNVEQDISLKVPASVTYQELFDLVWDELIKAQPENAYSVLTPVDIFQRQNDTKHKQITLRLTIAAYDRTLTAEVVKETLDKIALKAGQKLHAERI